MYIYTYEQYKSEEPARREEAQRLYGHKKDKRKSTDNTHKLNPIMWIITTLTK